MNLRYFHLSHDFRSDGEPVLAVWRGVGEDGECFHFPLYDSEQAAELCALLNGLIALAREQEEWE